MNVHTCICSLCSYTLPCVCFWPLSGGCAGLGGSVIWARTPRGFFLILPHVPAHLASLDFCCCYCSLLCELSWLSNLQKCCMLNGFGWWPEHCLHLNQVPLRFEKQQEWLLKATWSKVQSQAQCPLTGGSSGHLWWQWNAGNTLSAWREPSWMAWTDGHKQGLVFCLAIESEFCGISYLSMRKVTVKTNALKFSFSNLANYLYLQVFLSIISNIKLRILTHSTTSFLIWVCFCRPTCFLCFCSALQPAPISPALPSHQLSELLVTASDTPMEISVKVLLSLLCAFLHFPLKQPFWALRDSGMPEMRVWKLWRAQHGCVAVFQEQHSNIVQKSIAGAAVSLAVSVWSTSLL